MSTQRTRRNVSRRSTVDRNDISTLNNNDEKEINIILSTAEYYKPTSFSLNMPVFVLIEETELPYDKLVAVILIFPTKETKFRGLLYFMTEEHNFYILETPKDFIESISNYQYVILTDQKAFIDGKDGVILPIFIN